MKTPFRSFLLGASALAFAAVLTTLLLSGCASTSPSAPAQPAGAAANPSGATLWANNCGHCHNIRSPNSLSDAQWDIVLLHMRVRANLTAREHKEILAFLKSAH